MAGEDFLLKWNDHHALFFSGAEELCQNEEYTDVTLSAGSKFFPAHKLVLSVCSPYFRQLFRRLGNDKSVIYLKDVEPRHLELLLDYMYKGEIKVEEQELVTVLNTAQGLEIRGLTESGKQNESESPVKMTPRPEPVRPTAPKRVTPTPPPSSTYEGASKNYESANKKRKIAPTNSDTLFKIGAVDVSPAAPALSSPSLPRDSSSLPVPPTTPSRPIVKQEVANVGEDWNSSQSDHQMATYDDNMSHDAYPETALTATGYDHEGYEEGEYYQDDGMGQAGEQDDRAWPGPKVDIKVEKNTGDTSKWMPEVDDADSPNKSLPCPACGKHFATKHNLTQHWRVHSGERPFTCPICSKGFKQKAHMQKHMMAHKTREGGVVSLQWMGNIMSDNDSSDSSSKFDAKEQDE